MPKDENAYTLQMFDQKDYDTAKKEWQGMPEFVQEDQMSFKEVIVHFRSQKDVDAFAALIGQKITAGQKFLWFPAAEIKHVANKRYVDES